MTAKEKLGVDLLRQELANAEVLIDSLRRENITFKQMVERFQSYDLKAMSHCSDRHGTEARRLRRALSLILQANGMDEPRETRLALMERIAAQALIEPEQARSN